MKRTIKCDECHFVFHPLGFARHRTAHYERRTGKIKKPMPKLYRPSAFFLRECDGGGMSTEYARDLETAIRTMSAEWDSLTLEDIEWEGLSGSFVPVFNERTVKATRMYHCKRCQVYTMEDPTCFECGEESSSFVGRKTFVIYFRDMEKDLDGHEIVKIRNGHWELHKDGRRLSAHSTKWGAERMLDAVLNNQEK